MPNKILVAEDSRSFRETEVAMFEAYCRSDTEISQAATRGEALAAIAGTDDLKVVVTDLRMPNGGDGEAVASAAQGKGIRVIVLSSSLTDLSEDVRERCAALFDKKQDPNLKDVAAAIDKAIGS